MLKLNAGHVSSGERRPRLTAIALFTLALQLCNIPMTRKGKPGRNVGVARQVGL